MESWLLDLPAGLLILLVGLFVSKGSSRLRWICIVTALVTLALPVLASFLLQKHHCP
jgi:flagellar basal body-associated protein FliL